MDIEKLKSTAIANKINDPETVYQYYVQDDTCIDELYIIQDEIAGDMNHYQHGVYQINKVSLLLYNEDKSYIYSNFKDLWDAI